MKVHPIRKSPPGFSLIELLITIAVIAILAAILIPVVQGVMARSRETACAANLRALSGSLQLFCADNDGRLPVGYEINNNGPTNNWWYRTSQYTDRPMALSWSEGPDCIRNVMLEQPFNCPDVSAPYPGKYAFNGWVSYKMNVQVRLRNSGTALNVTQGLHKTRIPNPARFILVSEGRVTPEFDTYRSDGNAAWNLEYRHDGRANALFADGHVSSFTEAEMAAGAWTDYCILPPE